MKDLNYHSLSSLSKDIEKVNKSHKLSFKIKEGILTFGVMGLLVIYIIFGISCLIAGVKIPVPILCFANMLIVINSTNSTRRSRRHRTKLDALSSITETIDKIAKIEPDSKKQNLEPIYIPLENMMQAVSVKQENEDKKYDEKNCLAEYVCTVVNDLYVLDNKDKIRILREISRKIKTDNKLLNPVITDLYLLEEDEMPEELPVVQALELKPKKETDYYL